jgi:hypothetical protein
MSYTKGPSSPLVPRPSLASTRVCVPSLFELVVFDGYFEPFELHVGLDTTWSVCLASTAAGTRRPQYIGATQTLSHVTSIAIPSPTQTDLDLLDHTRFLDQLSTFATDRITYYSGRYYLVGSALSPSLHLNSHFPPDRAEQPAPRAWPARSVVDCTDDHLGDVLATCSRLPREPITKQLIPDGTFPWSPGTSSNKRGRLHS